MKWEQHNSDKHLIEAYQAGDTSALTSLVAKWHLEFCKKAYWLVKDPDMSKDIAQNSWRIIIDKLQTLEKPASFKSWAFRIVYSKSMDALRYQKRKRLKESELKQEQCVCYEASENDNKLLKEALLKAVQELPLQQQQVIRLFYTQEYSLKEISEMIGVSIGTAKSRLFHAREKLKLILKGKIDIN